MDDNRVVTIKGNPMSLSGTEVRTGDPAPDFVVVANDLTEVKLSSFRGKVCLIVAVHSLDTSVCDIEVRKFNEKVATFGTKVAALTISMDLPFAQKRWCGAAGVKNLQTLSDYRKADFGENFGVLIKELRLLARAVFIIDEEGVIRYIQIVKEVANEPDYEKALEALKGVTG